MLRFASLDVGSNTVRLLVAEKIEKMNFQPLRVERKITRLGGNFSREGRLDKEAMARTLDALISFARIMKEEGVEVSFAVATGVLREAQNGKIFIERIRKSTNIPLRLITGEDEARLVLKGVKWNLRKEDLGPIVADVGGWSTEILWVEKEIPRKTHSVRLGTVALCESFLAHDPPEPQELTLLGEYTRKILQEVRKDFEKGGMDVAQLIPKMVGTAGTMTTLAAIDQRLTHYDSQKINGHYIPRSRLENIFRCLCSLPKEKRKNIPGLESGREDVIIAGTSVVLHLLETFGLKELIVVDSGLLEGVLLDGLAQFI